MGTSKMRCYGLLAIMGLAVGAVVAADDWVYDTSARPTETFCEAEGTLGALDARITNADTSADVAVDSSRWDSAESTGIPRLDTRAPHVLYLFVR